MSNIEHILKAYNYNFIKYDEYVLIKLYPTNDKQLRELNSSLVD